MNPMLELAKNADHDTLAALLIVAISLVGWYHHSRHQESGGQDGRDGPLHG